VSVHIPSTGASTATARYRILFGNGLDAVRTVDQHLHRNQWVSLGNFTLHPGARVVLNNLTSDRTEGTANVAFDAVGFVPMAASGRIVSKKIDAVLSFDPYQRLDTDPENWNPAARHPFESMRRLYEWARDITTGVTSWQLCGNSHGNAVGSTCVGDKTWLAYNRWNADVETAGDGSGPAWDNEVLPLTQAQWMGMSNRRLGATLTAGEVASPSDYKVHQRLRIEFVVNEAGTINPGSVTLTGVQRAGDTHLPEFVVDVMRAYRDDYGIAMPDISYTAEDLRLYTHSSSAANPAADQLLPGRAYMDTKKIDKTSPDCVVAKAIGGGSNGYRPMLAQEYVRNEVIAWRDRVRALVNSGNAPAAVATGANELQDKMFNDITMSEFFDANADGTLWYLAPPIWMQVEARVCANGTVTPVGSRPIAESSWMPDLYLFIDNAATGPNGSPETCAAGSRACAIRLGDFRRFTHMQWAGDDPYDQCDWTAAGPRRNGNPWEMMMQDAADITPDKVKYCDETQWIDHD
jgi:hypothetical protein